MTGAIIIASFWGYFAHMRTVPPAVSLDCSGDRWPLGLMGLSMLGGLASGVLEAIGKSHDHGTGTVIADVLIMMTDFGALDDNLTLPILSGSFLYLLLQLFC
jgi:hypothetical protein